MATDPTNLYETYKNVYQRIRRSRGARLIYAQQAALLAKQVIEQRTLASVRALRVVEQAWITSGSGPSKSMADVFERAIRSKNYVLGRPILSTSAFGWNPDKGVVYAFSCAEYPGLIKIGATGGSPDALRQRLDAYATRHRISSIRVVTSLHATNPSELERKIHDELAEFRTRGAGKSNEWFAVTETRVRKIFARHKASA
jgi:hypothetical protein